MRRIDVGSAAGVAPAVPAAGTEGYFSNGNPLTGTPATEVPDWWLNMVQEELRAVVVNAGISPSKSNWGQVAAAIGRLAGCARTVLTANTVLTADHAGLVEINAAGGNVLVTLPAANAIGALGLPLRLELVRTDANAAAVVTVQRQGADIINGGVQTSLTLGVGDRVVLVGHAGGVWRIVAGWPLGREGVRYFTSSGALTAADEGVVEVSAAGGPVAINLPAVNSNSGRPIRYRFVRVDASANAVTLQRAGGDTIEGASLRLLRPGERLELVGNGIDIWRALGGQAVPGEAAPRMSYLLASATLTADDAGVVEVLASSAPIDIILPLANSRYGRPVPFTFVRLDGTAQPVRIHHGGGGDHIDGATFIDLAPGERLELVGNGIDAWRRITPLPGHQVLAVNGRKVFGDGLILQWGTVAGSFGEGEQTVTFPLAFPTECFQAQAIVINTGSTLNADVGIQRKALSAAAVTFYLNHYETAPLPIQGFDWFALGR